MRILVGHDARVDMTESDVVDIFTQRFPDVAKADVGAQLLPGTPLWSVQAFDEQGRPNAGAGYFVGPDRRLWQISSNPGIHDYDLAVSLLGYAYREGLATRLDEDLFSARLREITESRESEVRRFAADLRGGALRHASERRLP